MDLVFFRMVKRSFLPWKTRRFGNFFRLQRMLKRWQNTRKIVGQVYQVKSFACNLKGILTAVGLINQFSEIRSFAHILWFYIVFFHIFVFARTCPMFYIQIQNFLAILKLNQFGFIEIVYAHGIFFCDSDVTYLPNYFSCKHFTPKT